MVPWHKRVEFAARPTVGDTLKRYDEPGERIDVVHLRRLQQCCDSRPGLSAAVAASEETIPSRNCLWPDGYAYDEAFNYPQVIESFVVFRIQKLESDESVVIHC